MLSVSPAHTIEVVQFGDESQLAIVVDSFLRAPGRFRAQALGHSQAAADPSHYPGIRSPAPPEYGELLHAFLAPIIGNVFSVQVEKIKSVNSLCSMVLRAPEDLSLLQRIPHYDWAVHDDFAIMHYLCEPPHGGTSFYRHRSTAYEFIDEKRKKTYWSQLENDFKDKGPPGPGYICGDTEIFERIRSFDAAYNRLLVYRTSNLHSGNIDENYRFDPNPYTGRFTIASFMS